MEPSRSFASDNNAGVHPEVLEAIARANQGHVVGYGDDRYTESAVGKFREHFGADVEVFFVFNGTAANVLSLQALTRPFHAVLCPEMSHIYSDECGAPEKFTGCKLIPLKAPLGKLPVPSSESMAANSMDRLSAVCGGRLLKTSVTMLPVGLRRNEPPN